jgi:K+-transporting ATPase ATPase A chain
MAGEVLMSWQGFIELLALVAALGATVPLLGRYFADVYGVRADGSAPGDRVFKPIERFVYRVCGVDEKGEQRWNVYALSLLAFSLVSLLALYALQRAQGVLPLNPTDRTSVTPWGSFNTAVSFVTNTNWQWYSGEVTMSHLTQMIGLTVQNFVSAAAGMAVVVAMIRGITRTGTRCARQLLGRSDALGHTHPLAARSRDGDPLAVTRRHPELPRLLHCLDG